MGRVLEFKHQELSVDIIVGFTGVDQCAGRTVRSRRPPARRPTRITENEGTPWPPMYLTYPPIRT
jgi:hypothetical protein